MRKSLAEPVAGMATLLCPLCEFICSPDNPNDMYEHVKKEHTDEEGIEVTGWDLGDYEEDSSPIPTLPQGQGNVKK